MKKLLDEDDNDPVILLPWKWGCGPRTILLAILLTGLGWFLIRPEKWFINHSQTKEMTVPGSASGIQQGKPGDQQDGDRQDNLLKEDHRLDTTQMPARGRSAKKDAETTVDLVSTGAIPDYSPGSPFGRKRDRYYVQFDEPEKRRKVKSKNSKAERWVMLAGENIARIQKPVQKEPLEKTGIVDESRTFSPVTDSLLTAKTIGIAEKDSMSAAEPVKKQVDSIKADSLMQQDSSKAKQKKSNTYSWGAGLGITQQIPFDGQKAVPYSSTGRKSSVADYIPSAYVRFYKNNKWFIQAELRYGAPQYTRNIVYSVQKNSVNNTETNLTLKKTYYHQLPLGFNYYVLPGLTIGSGIVWNKFSGAVSEQKIQRTPVSGQPDSVISTSIFTQRTLDSNRVFSKSFVQFMSEVQYAYKRFTLGARYARGLQPYIRFQLPGEPVKEERNSSLQLFFRYELWKTKKK